MLFYLLYIIFNRFKNITINPLHNRRNNIFLLMLEKDKNTQLQLELQQEKQKQDEQSNEY